MDNGNDLSTHTPYLEMSDEIDNHQIVVLVVILIFFYCMCYLTSSNY